MSTERETLLAEIAERQARLAELDKEPDYEAWRPAANAARAVIGASACATPMQHNDRLLIEQLIAAFPKAPPIGSGMTEAEDQAFAWEQVRAAGYLDRKVSFETAVAIIHETLSRVQPRWPSEEELREMAESVLDWAYSDGNNGPYTCPKDAALEMARRIHAYQQGEQA